MNGIHVLAQPGSELRGTGCLRIRPFHRLGHRSLPITPCGHAVPYRKIATVVSGVRRRMSGNVRSLCGHFSGLVFHRPHGKRVLRNAFLIRLEPVGWQRPAAQGFFHVGRSDRTDQGRPVENASHVYRPMNGQLNGHHPTGYRHDPQESREHGGTGMGRPRRNRP